MDHQRLRHVLLWGVAALLGVVLVGAASVVISGWLLAGVEEANGGRREAVERSAVGDYFGGISAVFSGLALLLLVFTLLFQQRELRMQREELTLQRQELISSRQELRRSARADLRALHVQLTEMAMNDAALASVWNDYPDEPHEVVRQYLFANLTFGHFLLFFEWGEISEEELLGTPVHSSGARCFRGTGRRRAGGRRASPRTATRGACSASSSRPSATYRAEVPPARHEAVALKRAPAPAPPVPRTGPPGG